MNMMSKVDNGIFGDEAETKPPHKGLVALAA
jgi:hypothetical protein